MSSQVSLLIADSNLQSLASLKILNSLFAVRISKDTSVIGIYSLMIRQLKGYNITAYYIVDIVCVYMINIQ